MNTEIIKEKIEKVRGKIGVLFEDLTTGEGFTVLKGSKVSDHTVESFKTRGKAYCRLRDKLIADEVIVDGLFVRDYEFSAPSAASAVILGRTSNGNIDWKTAQGVSLRDV